MKNIFYFQKRAFTFPFLSTFNFSSSLRMRHCKNIQNSCLLHKIHSKYVHSSITKLINYVNNDEISKINSSKMIDTLVFNLEKEDMKQFKEVIIF